MNAPARVKTWSFAPAQAQTKGLNFANVRAFVEEQHGAEAGWRAVLDKLSPEDRDQLTGVVAVGWYSLSLYSRVIRAVDAAHGFGDLSKASELGRFEAARDLTTIHRMFLRLVSPVILLQKAAEYWHRHHDVGSWRIVRPAPNEAIGHLDGWAADEALCLELTAYLERAFELAGARGLRFQHPACRGRGDGRCTFTARWD
jgi:hypothetical protein